eukprot:13346915-Alexandrium_andersonii.AAC.1
MRAKVILFQAGVALLRVRPEQVPDWACQARHFRLERAIANIRAVEHDFEVRIIQEYTDLIESTLNLPTDSCASW